MEVAQVSFTGCVEFRRVVHLVVEALAQQQGTQFTCFTGTIALMVQFTSSG